MAHKEQMNNIAPDINSYTEIKLHNRACAEHDSAQIINTVKRQ